MHILIVPSWYPTTERPINGIFFREQAIALSKAGHKVGVIFPERKSIKELRFERKYWTRKIEAVDDQGVVTFRSYGWYWFPRVPYANAELFVRDGLRLYSRYAKDFGHPDIIHAHSMLYGGVLAATIRDRFGIPFGVTEHSSAFVRNLIRPWQLSYLRYIYNYAARVITVSPQLGNLLREKYGCPEELLCYVPNMVNVQEFCPSNESWRDAEPFIFLNIAILSENKGHRHLLKAFAKAFDDDDHVELWIGGDGEERCYLEELADQLGIAPKIRFLGMLARKEVAEAMKRCHAFVLSSLHETFGVVLIEAMACGKPVIATRCGGPENIVNPRVGILAEAGNVDEIAEAMKKMRHNYAQYDPVEIRKLCIDRYGQDRVKFQ